MSSAPDVVDPRQPADIRDQSKAESSITTNCMKLPVRERLIIADVSSSGDEFNLKVRKPYTITKQRERWTDDEHKKFLEALKLYGRAWRRIKEHIGTKTAVQIRSHAQKFFSKLERGVSSGDLAGKVEDIDFPPPRPKRKPSHPYPKKAGYNPSGEEVNRQPESIAYTPCINKRYSQLDAATISTHQNPLRTGHCLDVKLFDQTVIIPPVHKPVNPKRHLVKEDGISQLQNAQAIIVNLCQNEGPSPFVRVQTNLTVLKESLPLHQNGKNSGITTVDAAEESVVEFSTNEVSAAEDSQSAFEGNFISENCKDVNQAENCKVDSFDDNGSSMSSQLLKEDNPNNPMSVWIENLFRYYSGFLGPQFTAHGFPAKMVPTNPMACWPLMQASPMMNHPFHSAAMARMVANWTGLVAGSQGSIPISSKEAHCLPSYADGRYFAPWLDQRGFKQKSSTDNSCEKELASSVNVYEAPNMKNIKCTNEVIAQELQTKNLSDVAKDDDIEHGEKNGYLEDSDDNPPHGMETHEEENRLIEQSVNESDVGMDASDQAQHSLCTSIDEFEDGGKRSRDGSSSGSNTPLDGGNLSEAEMMPRYLETTIRDNDASSEKNHHQEADSGTERRCPKIRFKEIEKRKRHQQKDCKQGSLEDPKRIKGSAHDMDSWKEVSEEGRKAFRALFDNKNLPQTFPTVCDCQADNATIMDKQHVQRTLPCQNHAKLMADDTVAAQTKDRQYSIITCEIPTRYVDDEGEVSGSTSLHHVQEDNDRKVVKFTVSPRSGFVPYRRPLL